MDVYARRNRVKLQKVELQDQNQALREIEEQFINFLEHQFLKIKDNIQYILAVDDIYVSTCRVIKINDNLYFLEALETHEKHLKKGYGTILLNKVINHLKKKGSSFSLISNIVKSNIPSLTLHKKVGFNVIFDYGYDPVRELIDEKDYTLEYVYKENE